MDFEPSSSLESQMIVLQEQLVSAIIENQNLAEEVRKLRVNGSTDKLLLLLAREKEKNRLLVEKIAENSVEKVREKSLPPRDKSPRSHSRGRFGWRRKGLEKSKSLDQSEFLSSLSPPDDDVDWKDATQLSPVTKDKDSLLQPSVAEAELPQPRSQDSFCENVKSWLKFKIHEFIQDFSEIEEEEQPSIETEGDPLTVKKLKDNVLRFTTILKPFSDLSVKTEEILRWESPTATLMIFVIYMAALFYGYILPSIFIFCLTWLTRNYFIKRGWTINILGKKKARENSESTDATNEGRIGDKFTVVLQVARRVQNILGTVSDGSEKLKNLLNWEHEFTRTLFVSLWLLMGASLLLTPSQLFSLLGLYLGVKLFIVDYIFYRFPRIRLKYDSTTRLWDTLPTDAELERRKYEKNGIVMVNDVNVFLDLFNLPPSEAPLPGWHGGKRCTLVNRDKSITGAFKNGRLYLTNNYLCFERSKSHPSKNITIPISDVITLEKANSYPWIPGGGMAVEVFIASGKVYFFGGIMNRDEVFDAILDGCRKSGAPIKKKDHNREKEEENNKETTEQFALKENEVFEDESRNQEDDAHNPMEILDFID